MSAGKQPDHLLRFSASNTDPDNPTISTFRFLQSFSVDPDPNYQAALQREKSPAYEYSKIAAFGIKKLLRHSTGDALTLWVTQPINDSISRC